MHKLTLSIFSMNLIVLFLLDLNHWGEPFNGFLSVDSDVGCLLIPRLTGSAWTMSKFLVYVKSIRIRKIFFV